jgi:hypothetical protein
MNFPKINSLRLRGFHEGKISFCAAINSHALLFLLLFVSVLPRGVDRTATTIQMMMIVVMRFGMGVSGVMNNII